MNNKFKISYTPSKNEFILLAGLIIVIIAVVFLNYLILPQWNALKEAKTDYEGQVSRLEGLRAEHANLGKYLQKNEELSDQLEELRKGIPPFLSEEEITVEIDDSSVSSGLQVLGISFGGVLTQTQDVFTSNLKMSAGTSEKTAKSASSESGKDQSGGAVRAGDSIRSERITISYTGTYAQLDDFMKGLEDGARQVYFRSLVAARTENSKVAGMMTLLVFSSESGDGEYPGYDYETPAIIGKSDPFAAFEGYVEDDGTPASATAAENPDFYIILNTYDDNADKIFMGKYPVSGTQITSDGNQVAAAELKIYTDGGGYGYTCTLGGKTVSGTFADTASAGSLSLSVLSSARKNAQDKVGITLNVVNDSGLPLKITAKNDDAANPRFVLGSTTGSVSVS